MDNSQRVEVLDRNKVHNGPNRSVTPRSIWVSGPIIVGAGPSGLAVAACLKQRGLPSLILEQDSCIASLWQLKTYDRLHLHLPKSFCQLPHLPFPDNFSNYPSKHQFLSYLEDYRARFGLDPVFDTKVVSAGYDYRGEFWRVKAEGEKGGEVREYVSQWLVVATGENAEEVVPDLEGAAGFGGRILHSSAYKSGEAFAGKSVLVVGCGNSGMEVCLDLCNSNARPSLVVRDSVHVLPREMLGRSTFGLSMWLLKWLPLRLVDRLLLLMSHLLLGDTTKLGLRRPEIGPLELKSKTSKTPVLDVGTLAKIKSGHIKVFPAIKRLTRQGAEFVDGRKEKFDAVILATGYKSNVPLWLKEKNHQLGKKEDNRGKQKVVGWKGERGLYAVGFSKQGLLSTSIEAMRVAQDIEHCWKPM